MKRLFSLSVCLLSLLVITQPCLAADGSGSVYLQPWLVGIIAVAVFLVVAFAFLMFNHYMCEQFYDKDEDYPDEELIDDSRTQAENHYETVDEKQRYSSSDSESPSPSYVFENKTFSKGAHNEETTAL